MRDVVCKAVLSRRDLVEYVLFWFCFVLFCFVLFCFVFMVIKPCDGAQLRLKKHKRIFSFSSRYNVTLKLI